MCLPEQGNLKMKENVILEQKVVLHVRLFVLSSNFSYITLYIIYSSHLQMPLLLVLLFHHWKLQH